MLSTVLKGMSLALAALPVSASLCLFRYARNLFSVQMNERLEAEVFCRRLKGLARTVELPRLRIPVVVERKMRIRTGDESQRYYWLGQHDEVSSFLLRHLRPSDVFIDIGANCGFMTLVASSLVPPEQIYAFEPNPDTFRELQDNLELNAIAVNAFNLALSDKAERCRLFVPEGACGGSSIEAKNYQRRDLLPGEEPPEKFHEVDAVIFDDFRNERVKNLPAGVARYVVKLDAEGHEIPIIAGMKAFIRENIDRITLVVELYESEYVEAVKAIGALGLKGRILLGDGTRGPAVAPEKNRFANYCFEAPGADGGGEA